jgi:pyrophosphatase PpaX
MPLQGVIFDLDGTLADTLPICISAFQTVFSTYLGKSYSDDEVRATFGPSEEGVLLRLMPDAWPETLEAYLRAYEADHHSCAAPFPGIDRALRILGDRGVRLAVVTGKGPHTAEISLRRTGISSAFEIIEAGSPDGGFKPKSIQKVLDRWGYPPETVAYVGDTPRDMRDARQTGLLAIGAAWASTATVQPPPAGEAQLFFTTVGSFIDWIDGATQATGPGTPRKAS